MAYETLARVTGPGVRADIIELNGLVVWADPPLSFLSERPLSELREVCTTLGLGVELIGCHHYKYTGNRSKKRWRR